MDDLFHSCALAAFIDALPMDDGHSERSRILAYQYYELTLKEEKCDHVKYQKKS